MRSRWYGLYAIVLMACMSLSALASNGCHGQQFNPLTDLCWSCFFPLTMGSTTVMSGHLPDTPNPTNPICHCGSNPAKGWGTTVGFWVPVALVDVTQTPYCMVTLGGWRLPAIKHRGCGTVAVGAAVNTHSFYEVHVIQLPFTTLFPSLASGSCQTHHGLGIEYLSETDPAWHSDTLNALAYPGNLPVVAHILKAQVLNAADCVAASVHLPLDRVTWNAGCQGSLYPVDGVVQAHVDSVQASTLIAERAVFLLHRLAIMRDSSRHDVCREHVRLFLPKSRYRYQLIYPVKKRCYPFGHTTATWASGVMTAFRHENFGYVIWKKENCCVQI